MSNINSDTNLINMLCHQFEDLLIDYLDGTLDKATQREVAAHALRCPLCHELLNEVKTTVVACQNAFETLPAPSLEFEARILQMTMPEAAMSCAEFEELLTDYLDGFLSANLFHRWERHAILCSHCTNLPGEVVRSIGACYSSKVDELPIPAGLHERILEATLGTTQAQKVKMSIWVTILQTLENAFRPFLAPILTPQFASVAIMLLMAFVVFTNADSADGSISGVYQKGVQLAAQTYEQSADAVEIGITNGLNLHSQNSGAQENKE